MGIGKLTTVGQEQAYKFGQTLKERYMDKTNFLTAFDLADVRFVFSGLSFIIDFA